MPKTYPINEALSEASFRFVYAVIVDSLDILGTNDTRRPELELFIRCLGDTIDKINADNTTPAPVNITDKEYELIRDIVQHNEYGERGCLDNHPWSWAVCETKSRAAVLGSLIKKGLANQEGKGNDASCWLTEAGKQAYVAKFGAEGTWRN